MQNIRESLINPSCRRRPASMLPILLDSGIRRNDEKRIDQRFLRLYRVLLAALLSWALSVQGDESQELEQQPIAIQGRQAEPRTLYIQPWKQVGRPLDSAELEGGLREEADPLERDTFQRELELHRQGYSID